MQITPMNSKPIGADIVNWGEGGNSPFHAVREGQIIKAEVVAAEGSSLTIKLSDGSTVKADFPGAQVMLPGDQLELMMMSKADGNIHLRLTTINGQQVQMGTGDLQVRLMDMGVQPSEINTKAAQFLVDRNVQPTPERVALLVKIAIQYPELPASVALFVAENNIPVTQQNINALMLWLQSGQTLGNEAQQLINDVNLFLTEQLGKTTQPELVPSIAGQTEQNAEPLQNKAMHTNVDHSAAMPGQVPANDAAQTGLDARAKLLALIAQLNNPAPSAETAQPAFMAEITQGQSGVVAEQILTNSQQAVFQNAFMSIVSHSPVERAIHQLPQNAVLDFASTLANTNETQVQQAIEGFLSKFPLTAEQKAEVAQTLQIAYQTGRVAASTVLADSAVDGQAQMAQQPTSNAQETIAQQNTMLQGSAAKQNGTAINQPQVVGDAAIQEMQQLLQVLDKLTVGIRHNAPIDAENLQNAVKSQQQIADSVQSGLSRVMGDSSNVTQRAADISSRIQLGNNIENFYYCQIPIEMSQNKSTAELYVFERKQKGNAEERTNTTILIALETQNMGRVETVMRSERDSLGIEFRVQSPVVVNYLQKTTAELAQSLAGDDFAVKEIRVVQMNKPVTPLNVDQMLGEKEYFQLQTVDISI